MDEMQPIEALIGSGTRLAVIDTVDRDRVIEWLRKMFSSTGRAGYVWTAEQGLQRIAIEHIPIPGTQRPLDVLHYILSSYHFGIYLLCDFQKALSEPDVFTCLEKLMADADYAHKLVLLIGTNYKLPTRLETRVDQMTII